MRSSGTCTGTVRFARVSCGSGVGSRPGFSLRCSRSRQSGMKFEGLIGRGAGRGFFAGATAPLACPGPPTAVWRSFSPRRMDLRLAGVATTARRSVCATGVGFTLTRRVESSSREGGTIDGRLVLRGVGSLACVPAVVGGLSDPRLRRRLDVARCRDGAREESRDGFRTARASTSSIFPASCRFFSASTPSLAAVRSMFLARRRSALAVSSRCRRACSCRLSYAARMRSGSAHSSRQ
mmetsp:Transcript_2877/g.8938  ORF Transcript_2877/g.8938 Transcript_2877/m.8938 type:complete len:237 (+) Transcript_2877:122-832(+)